MGILAKHPFQVSQTSLLRGCAQALAESLDRAVRVDDAYFNKLVRIMATRCMTQAQYIGSGDFAPPEYHHYGLAAPLYTHFTSPIRRCPTSLLRLARPPCWILQHVPDVCLSVCQSFADRSSQPLALLLKPTFAVLGCKAAWVCVGACSPCEVKAITSVVDVILNASVILMTNS